MHAPPARAARPDQFEIMGRKIGRDRRERPPAILDPAVVAVLIGERAIERLVIQQGVARPGRPPEAAAPDEDIVCAALEILGLEIFGKSGHHGRADAGADKDIEHHAALAKGLVDTDMRRSEAAAAGGDESDRATGQEPDQAVDIDLILERDMVMHEAGQPSKPGRGAADFTAPPVVNANEAARRRGMDLAGEGFDIRQLPGGGISMTDEQHQIGLADRLPRPRRGLAVAEIDHQRRGLFEFVEPVGDFGSIQRAPGKHGVEAGGIDDLRRRSRPAPRASGDRTRPAPARTRPRSAPPFAPSASAERGGGAGWRNRRARAASSASTMAGASSARFW